MSLDKNAKIYVAGHRGLVGSAIWKNLQEKVIPTLWERPIKSLTCLTEQPSVNSLMKNSPNMYSLQPPL